MQGSHHRAVHSPVYFQLSLMSDFFRTLSKPGFSSPLISSSPNTASLKQADAEGSKTLAVELDGSVHSEMHAVVSGRVHAHHSVSRPIPTVMKKDSLV